MWLLFIFEVVGENVCEAVQVPVGVKEGETEVLLEREGDMVREGRVVSV